MTSADFEAIFASAKALSLTDFLERELNVKARKVGSSLRFANCPWCGNGTQDSIRLEVYEDSRCHCHRCGEGGDIINVAKQLWGKKPVECARVLTGLSTNMPSKTIRPKQDVPKVPDAEKEAISVLRRSVLQDLYETSNANANEPECMDYLTIERGIDSSTIQDAMRRKMLGFLPSDPHKCKQFLLEHIGEERLKASGFWKDEAKVPAIVFRPIMFFMPGFHSAEFRIIGSASEGEIKSIRYGVSHLPYVWRGVGNASKSAMVVEGFIDLLASIDLGFTGHVVGFPGAGSWGKFREDLFPYLASKLDVQKWVLAFDQDDELVEYGSDKEFREKNPGQYWVEKLKQVLDSQNQAYLHKAPPAHSDINDLLLAKRCA